MKNVLIITGTRADYGLLKPLILEMRKSKILKPRILVTGMHTLKKFGNTVDEIIKDGFEIAAVVKISERDDMLQSLNKEILGIRKFCLTYRPDLTVVLGDRDEMFAGAIVAGHLKIPVAHIHGGDLTGYGVDEAVRHSITKFSHLHFAASEKSYKRILQLGEEKRRVFNVGAIGLDDIDSQNFFSKKELSEIFGLDLNKKWFLVLHHPTPLDNATFENQISPLFKVLSIYPRILKIVIYPNSDTGSEVFIREINKHANKKEFFIFKNLDRKKYLSLFKECDLLLGNSSSGIIEAGFLKTAVINIGNRQKGREKGENVIDCGYDEASINDAISKALFPFFQNKLQHTESPYWQGGASKKIKSILEKNINNKNLFFKRFNSM